MSYRHQAKCFIDTIVQEARKRGCSAGFTIGTTAKIGNRSLYFTPLRFTSVLVTGGVIVYSEDEALDVARLADGRVEYILVDAEKKIPGREGAASFADVEKALRQNVNKSTLWFYKANDLSVDAVDGLIAQLTKRDPIGLNGRRVAIIGAGNIGFKLALRFLERGANVTITRRNENVLTDIVRAINHVKPTYTVSCVEGTTDNAAAAFGAHFLIGTSAGLPAITAAMIDTLATNAIVVDVGKGVLFPDAIIRANERGLTILRLDVTAAFEGLVHHMKAVENILEKRFGRRIWRGQTLISGGLLGAPGEIVVDNAHDPNVVYGVADGRGDFVRELSAEQQEGLHQLKNAILISGRKSTVAETK